MTRRIAALAIFCGSLGLPCFAQGDPTNLTINSQYQNLDFATGNVGQLPPGWLLGTSHVHLNSASVVSGRDCFLNQRCVLVQSPGDDGEKGVSSLAQTFDAAPYRDKNFTYRAIVRAAVQGSSAARLQVHIHRFNGTTTIRDDMGDRPITSSLWTLYEITVPVAFDARDIMIFVQVRGTGSAWADGLSISAGDSPNNLPDEEAVRALVTKFANSRNAHDGIAVAECFSEDAEFIELAAPQTVVKGKQALGAIWASMKGQGNRTIQTVDFSRSDLAVVRVHLEGSGAGIKETFVAVKSDSGWHIRIHQQGVLRQIPAS